MTAPLVALVGYRAPVPFGAGYVESPDPSKTTPSVVSPHSYVDALRRAGAITCVVPVGERVELIDRFDGLLLIGGGDVVPARYGGQQVPELFGVDPERDETEVEITLRAAGAGKPVLAICRGIQVLNVAFGGTLVEHITGGGHRARPGESALHAVAAEPGSVVASACGTSFEAYSAHHQAVRDVPDALRVTARAPDGVVEAVEGDGWVVGVQWHPEVTAAKDAAQQALFDAFARACTRR